MGVDACRQTRCVYVRVRVLDSVHACTQTSHALVVSAASLRDIAADYVHRCSVDGGGGDRLASTLLPR